MKLLFLSALYPPQTRGGGEVSTYLIAEGLKAGGHEVEVLTAESTGLPLTAKPLFERAWARKMAKAMQGQANWNSFDVVHAHDFRTAQVLSELINMGAVQKEKAYVTVRDYAQICGSPNNLLADGSRCPGCESLSAVVRNRAVVEAPWLRKPFRIWQYWYNIDYRLASFRAIPNHVYISNAQLEEVKKRQDLSGIKTQVIYNPVPAEYFSAESQLGEPNRILFVGTLESYKGAGLLLQAAAELGSMNYELKIVGDGAGREKFEQQAQELGIADRVTFAGRVAWDHMMAEYDQAQIVVAPHLWVEPFGRTTVEAMARGQVGIAANLGGPGELIQDGKTGLLFKPASAEDLVKKLQLALEMSGEQRVQIQKNARDWVAEHLSVRHITERYEDAYQRRDAVRAI